MHLYLSYAKIIYNFIDYIYYNLILSHAMHTIKIIYIDK